MLSLRESIVVMKACTVLAMLTPELALCEYLQEKAEPRTKPISSNHAGGPDGTQ